MAVEVERHVALPRVPLAETDGEPLETSWHRDAITLLVESLSFWFRDRTDFFVGGNMFIYFSEQQARNWDYRGPDFFYVDGVSHMPLRPYWAVWQEGGRYPNVIIELTSPTTARVDRTTKKTLYERTFRTPEYFCYDPADRQLEGWRLGARQRYQVIPADERGWLWVEELELWLGTWTGAYLEAEAVWLRFYDTDGRLVPIRAEAEWQRAEAERQRAEAAEAELARLRARLLELEGDRTAGESSGA